MNAPNRRSKIAVGYDVFLLSRDAVMAGTVRWFVVEFGIFERVERCCEVIPQWQSECPTAKVVEMEAEEVEEVKWALWQEEKVAR